MAAEAKGSATSGSASAGRGRALTTSAVVIVAVLALYGPSLHAPFIFDDRPGIIDNPTIRRLWPPVGDGSFRGPLNPPVLAPTARRPLPNLTFAFNYRLGGLDPWGYRLVNLLLHALAASLLAAVVRRTLRLPAVGLEDGSAWWLSLAVALLWAVHPLVTEAVVYVTQRTELLAACGSLAALWAALRYWAARSDRGRRAWLAAAGLATLAGMASKEWVAALPLIVVLYERTFLVGSWRALQRSWPLHLTLAAGWLVLVLLNAGGISGMTDARHQVALPVWWLTQAKAVLLYLKLAVWPWPLSIHYAPNYVTTVSEAWPWLAALALVAIATLALVWRRPAARFVVVASLLILAPTLVLPVPKMIVAERRMYVPLAGLIALALVGGYRWLAARLPRAQAGRVGAAVATALLVVLASVSAIRLQAYATVVTIWRDAVAHQPDDPMAHYNLGVALLDAGRPPAETMPYFEAALRLDPDYPAALDNLGMVLNRLGRSEEARGHLERALTIEPNDVVAYNNLGIALTRTGRAQEALPYLQRALELEPEQPKSKVHVNLGNALLQLGRTDEAIAHFERAVALAPDDADAHYSLGAAFMQVGRTADAVAAFERTLQLAPDDVEAHNNLASVLLQSGQIESAITHFQRALVLRPDSANLHSNLGTALLMAGSREAAIAQLESALRLQPDQLNAQRNLGSALADAGRPREAIARFRQALRLEPNDAVTRFKCAQAHASLGERADALAMAEAAQALAQSDGQSALAGEISSWLAAQGATAPR